MAVRRLGSAVLFVLALVCAAGLSCDSTPSNVNPASLWISYGQREVDLVLIDHEPPPF